MMQDHLTKMVVLRSRETSSAKKTPTVNYAVVQDWMAKNSAPICLHSDWSKCILLQSPAKHSAIYPEIPRHNYNSLQYHPQANGMVEHCDSTFRAGVKSSGV